MEVGADGWLPLGRESHAHDEAIASQFRPVDGEYIAGPAGKAGLKRDTVVQIVVLLGNIDFWRYKG